MSAWHDEARRLHADGVSIAAICRQFGKSSTAVRVAVDAAYRDKQLESNRRQKSRERTRVRQREELKGVRVRIEPLAERIDHATQRAYADQSAPRPLTLATISLPLLPDEVTVRKFAPRTRIAVSPGAERWREHNERMLRTGRIVPTADLLSEWRT